MSTKIKICGLTNFDDAQLALRLGADFLGFNFYRPSPRYVTPNDAAEIIRSLPDETATVGIFVNETTDTIAAALEQCPLKMVQLHGDETDDHCRAAAALGVEVIKAIRVRRPEDINLAQDYQVHAVLLDAFREELYGGTGHAFDWTWLRQGTDKPVFLAGGINPDNITEALAVGVYAIDLCSGVEKSPGLKDQRKMKDLFDRIARYDG